MDRARPERVGADRNGPQDHAWRARIVLAAGEGCGTAEIMCRAGVSKPSVRRWRRRFLKAGVGGLWRDKTRKPDRPGDGRGHRHLPPLVGAADLGGARARAAPCAALQPAE